MDARNNDTGYRRAGVVGEVCKLVEFIAYLFGLRLNWNKSKLLCY